jgi:hypothetical protein
VYEIKTDERTSERTDAAVAVEVKDGGFIVSVAASTKAGPRAATKTRVSTLEVEPRESRRGPVAGQRCKVIDELVVEVPAGKSTAIRVDLVYSADGEESTVSRWFAPNVGLVKMVNGGGSRTTVLKSFTPGK